MSSELPDRALAEAFAGLAEEAVPRDDCPDPERIWAAVAGEAPPDECRDVIDHTVTCPVCAEAWRLAKDFRGAEAVERPAAPVLTSQRWRLVALAAGLLLLVGIGFRFTGSPPPPDFRGGGAEAIRSSVADAPLPRSDCRLTWEDDLPGSLYDLTVTTEDLEVVAVARGLEDRQYRVEADRLAGLAPGARLLWRVEAVRPDGSRTTSRTFVARLE